MLVVFFMILCEDLCALCTVGLHETETVAKLRGNPTNTGMWLRSAMRTWHQCSTKHYRVSQDSC